MIFTVGVLASVCFVLLCVLWNLGGRCEQLRRENHVQARELHDYSNRIYDINRRRCDEKLADLRASSEAAQKLAAERVARQAPEGAIEVGRVTLQSYDMKTGLLTVRIDSGKPRINESDMRVNDSVLLWMGTPTCTLWVSR